MFVQVKKVKIELPNNSTAWDLAKKLNLTGPDQALCARIQGKLYDLSHILNEGDDVELIDFHSAEGKDLFWHSSAHVLAQAVLRLWPNALPTIGPSIENGFYYDFANLTISEEDLLKIEKEAKAIIEENFKPERVVLKNKEEAKKLFAKNPFKCEMIDEFDTGEITGYKQGEFFDLCRGPHLPVLGKIKAFKVLKTSGAYWRADQKREMLTRIYGISFPEKKMLTDYLTFLEEAKKRDHKLIGQNLDLFSFKEEGPGMPFIHPKGMVMWEELLKFLRELFDEYNYVEIKTPILLSKELWETSGHWSYYRQNMYTSEIEEKEFAIKPMNCPGGMLFYKTHIHSYRELPYKVAEIGLVHRHEPSGALNGLFRVRSFHQDDAHIFMKPDQIQDGILDVISFASKLYMTFGLSYRMELSTRPAKSIGSVEDWEMATQGLKGALDEHGHSYKINEGDGAFYGPKIDFHIKDALGRSWQCGTIQLDMALPERFQLEYVDSDGKHKRPIMIHRAMCGSIERFFGVIIEHFAGNFPLWISPLGVRLITVAERHKEYASKLLKRFKEEGLSCDIDDSNESVGKKIRNAQLLKINYMLTIGDQEVEKSTISLRTRDNVVHGEMSLQSFLEKVLKEKKEKALISPFTASE
ncbi:MAG: threonine--tRNA ligase [Chlamydiae bacterium]|nr:threonine--tRNA ligase [Chlamydiota bacterium]